MKALLAEAFDAVFVGCGAPRGRDLDAARPPGSGGRHPHRHRLAGLGLLRPRHAASAKRVIVLGGGNTAMDCCRSARRLGAERREGDRALAASTR